ncbi:MAG TPA: hypothetical protein VFI29_01040 [Hanamia sp.]|nr:hypothetical protein [Hanamia sp.]
MKKYILGSFAILTIILSSCSSNTATPKIDFVGNKKALESSIKALVDVNKKMNDEEVKFVQNKSNETPEYEKQFTIFAELLNQLKSGIDEGDSVSNDYLNYINPEMKHMFKDVYLEANKLWLTLQEEQLNKIKNNVNGFMKLSDSINLDELKKKLIVAGGDSLTSKQIDDTLMNSKLKNWIGSEIETSKKIDSLMTVWWNFVKLHQDILNDNEFLLGKRQSDNRSYWKIILYLGIGDFVVTIIYSLLVVLTMFLSMVIIKGTGKLGLGSAGTFIIMIPKILISISLQVYFWVLWASFCAFTVFYFIDAPQVTHNWIYYATGFIAVSAPMSYLSSKEQEIENSQNKRIRIRKYAGAYILISIAAYLVFCFYPKLMDYKFISFVNDWLSSI